MLHANIAHVWTDEDFDSLWSSQTHEPDCVCPRCGSTNTRHFAYHHSGEERRCDACERFYLRITLDDE